MKKFIYMTVFILSFIFIGITGVKAANLDMKTVTLECIYSDGGLYTSEYDLSNSEDGKKYIINRSSYNLNGVSTDDSKSGASNLFLNSLSNNGQCHNKLYHLYVNTSNKIGVNYYKFGANFNSSDNNNLGLWTSNWGALGKVLFDVFKQSDINNINPFKLISERYITTNNTTVPNTIIYYVQENTDQVVSFNSYISLEIYDNVVLLRNGERVTRLGGDSSIFKGITRNSDQSLSGEVPDEIYINSPEPQAIANSSYSVSYKYNSGQTIYSFSKNKDSVHTKKYVLTDEPNSSDLKRSDELCESVLKNTSPLLKGLIKWIQILVPVLLIVLTALDIGKIVISGNIDEELPKRKRIIVLRFVVVIVFFFLPVIVRLMTSWLIDSGMGDTNNIKYVDCLFK